MENIDLASLLLFTFITIYTPGPANIACTSLGVRFGIKRTTKFVYGSGIGFTFTSLLGGLLSNLLLTIVPSIELVMRLVGSAYILYLAYKMLKIDYSFTQDNQQTSTQEFGFKYGFVIQLLNIKSIIFIITLYTTFLNPLIGKPVLIFFSAVVLGLIGLGANFLWASLGAAISSFLNQERIKGIVNVLLALLLVYTALKLSGIFQL
jgi:cysteine/O-acetylserine efflux protein